MIDEIINSNRLIAKFMGLINNHASNWYCSKDKEEPAGHYIDCDSSYHNNYKLLMEVIDKIESLGYFVTIYSDSILISVSRPMRSDIIIYDKTLVDAKAKNKKELIWYGVLSFIEWYNQTITKNQQAAEVSRLTAYEIIENEAKLGKLSKYDYQALMIKFAKLHCDAQLKEILKNLKFKDVEFDLGGVQSGSKQTVTVSDRDSVIGAYKLTNIK